MSKNTPRQYYNIANENGMKLRSGKIINCIKTSQLGKEASELLTIYRKCDDAFERAYSRHGNGEWDIIGNDWIFFYCDENFQKLIDRVVGGYFSTQCTKLYALDNFLQRNRTTVNRYHETNKIKTILRDIICKKIKDSIKTLHDMRDEGQERLCGCCDLVRAEDEQLMISNCFDEGLGPGYFVRDEHGYRQWISTPEISIEEFKRNLEFEKLRWRHDLQRLAQRFEDHLAYFKRVPHHNYRQAYLALSYSKINEDCAKNILSFLH